MGATLYSFKNVFGSTFDDEKLDKIIIPIIQRDYVQGRRNSSVDRVRSRFLDTLYKAITKKPITLDFVYGDIKDGIMTPLDGQQRLTTLYLMHWYAAKKESISEIEYSFLEKFSYENRYSSRDFCSYLIKFTPKFENPLSDEIRNENWFPYEWEHDPTIRSMLVVLDAIDLKFRNIPDLWQKLMQDAITFYFLPIKEMGLTDEIYIKMNSRGKPLTTFEHFKAELENDIKKVDESLAKEIIFKIDTKWTDLLWFYHDENNHLIDDKFLNCFKFICDIIAYKHNEVIESYDEFDLLDKYFSLQNNDKEFIKENVRFVENFFDCWSDIPDYKNPDEFLNSFLSTVHAKGKIKVDNNERDIFKNCNEGYCETETQTRKFHLDQVIRLYAITFYLENKSKISFEQFLRRFRIINNLVQNSENELAERKDSNRMTPIIAQTESILLNGEIDENLPSNFSTVQISEEKEKIKFLKTNTDQSDALFELEDHRLLYGQIGILGLNNLSSSKKFIGLFDCDHDEVNRALMTIGDYGQLERNQKYTQYGSKNESSWKNLFHKSSNNNYDETKRILAELLSKNIQFSNEGLSKFSDDYLKECENKATFDYRYYFVKYKKFRPDSFGKYHYIDKQNSPYLLIALRTKQKLSENSFCPYFTEVDENHLQRAAFENQKLIFNHLYITRDNHCFSVRNQTDDSLIETIVISQNKNGIDTEDRILLLKKYIEDNASRL